MMLASSQVIVGDNWLISRQVIFHQCRFAAGGNRKNIAGGTLYPMRILFLMLCKFIHKVRCIIMLLANSQGVQADDWLIIF